MFPPCGDPMLLIKGVVSAPLTLTSSVVLLSSRRNNNNMF